MSVVQTGNLHVYVADLQAMVLYTAHAAKTGASVRSLVRLWLLWLYPVPSSRPVPSHPIPSRPVRVIGPGQRLRPFFHFRRSQTSLRGSAGPAVAAACLSHGDVRLAV